MLHAGTGRLQGRPGAAASGPKRILRPSISATLLRPQPSSSAGASSSLPNSLSVPNAQSLYLDGKQAGMQLKGEEVEEAAMWKCIQQHQMGKGHNIPAMKWSGETLNSAYERCGQVTSEYAKTFYLGTQLMTPEQAKAIWAVYVWCRRTDELVDGPNASKITPKVCALLPTLLFCLQGLFVFD